jgi:hypothetical protein
MSQLEFLLSRAKLRFGAHLVNELSRVGSLINKYLWVELSRLELARYPPLAEDEALQREEAAQPPTGTGTGKLGRDCSRQLMVAQCCEASRPMTVMAAQDYEVSRVGQAQRSNPNNYALSGGSGVEE